MWYLILFVAFYIIALLAGLTSVEVIRRFQQQLDREQQEGGNRGGNMDRREARGETPTTSDLRTLLAASNITASDQQVVTALEQAKRLVSLIKPSADALDSPEKMIAFVASLVGSGGIKGSVYAMQSQSDDAKIKTTTLYT